MIRDDNLPVRVGNQLVLTRFDRHRNGLDAANGIRRSADVSAGVYRFDVVSKGPDEDTSVVEHIAAKDKRNE